MPRKTKIIFIIVFVIVGAVMLGIYYANQTSNGTNNESGGSGYSIFNPFNSSKPSSTTDTPENTIPEEAVEPTFNEEVAPQVNKLYKVTNFAVSGATFFEDSRPLPIPEVTALEGGEVETKVITKKTTKPVAPKFEIVPSLRYVEKSTGHIYQMYLDTKIENKISNSTIPTIYEALFDGSAKTIIYRYLSEDSNTITSFMATLGSSKGEFLPANIIDVSLSPDRTKFFYITKTANGVAGNTRSFSDTKKSQVFTSSFSEWLSQWPVSTKIFLNTKPSYLVSGSLYILNTTSGEMKKVFGGVPGLTTLANNLGTHVLYNNSTSSGPNLEILDVDKHTTIDLATYGLPEKCVWNNTNTFIYCAIPNNISGSHYPDSWYQGLVSFDDSFVKIDANTGDAISITDSFGTTSVDATHLFLDKTESTLFFTNKKDGTLWGLDLK
jgi:hypothetical protein